MRKFLLVLTGFLFCLGANAQNFGGGFYAGMTTSQINGDGFGGFDLPGFHAGFLTNRRINDKSQLQLELAFIQKGSRMVPDSTNNYRQYKARLNYIEIPLLYQLEWQVKGQDFSFEFGPALDINIYAQEEWNYNKEPSDIPFYRFNLTGIFGINWHFSRKWYVNFRSNISITPIRRGVAARGIPGRINLGGYGQRNVVLSTALVYRFADD